MMNEQRRRSLILLTRVQALIGAVVAVAVFISYSLSMVRPIAGPSLISAILGVAGVAYFISVHQLLKQKHLAQSALILTIITAFNFVLVIATTGGLDSPYYSLWLLAIVVAGIFGRRETIITLAGTVCYFIYALINTGFNEQYVGDHLVQLGITFVAAGLAEWVHTRSRKNAAARNQLDDLSGQLTDEQLRSQALVASIGEGVVVINNIGQIQLFNHTAETLTGWDEGSATGLDYKVVLALTTETDAPLSDEVSPFTKSITEKIQVASNNLLIANRSGQKIAVSVSVSPILTASGTASGAIALIRDISREKAVERQKDEFVSTASHEMRTPVAAIEGYISLAMNPNIATIDERAMKYLEKAHLSITHLGDLFRDLLSVTKAEDNSLNMKIEPINLSELLQSVVDDMQFVAAKKQLSLVYQISSSSGKALAPIYHVAANSERLREVIMNLIDNSIKFTSQGGIKVSLTGNDKSTQIAVSDTGLGIANEDISHLFQKFYRIDSSATRTIGGTGLGLYLCRTVIELFNGRIWVTSKIGQGSTFHIELPRLSDTEYETLRSTSEVSSQNQNLISEPPSNTSSGLAPARPIEMPIPGERTVDSLRSRSVS